MSVADIFVTPPADCRPTPLFWWTGADLDRGRLAVQLDELAAKGIGGTIVGYSHLPDGDLDHGTPAPLTDDWWDLFRWFTEASAERGMTVGIQDYGLNGGVLIAAGQHTGGLGSGSLQQVLESRKGPGDFTVASAGAVLVTAVALDERGVATPIELISDGGQLRYSLPAGSWRISLVLNRSPLIGHRPSAFDPLHPDSGQRLIEAFYQPFQDHLGPYFGTTFTTVFQDELDFGLRMPMWNDLVAERLSGGHGFGYREWLPALWVDLGDGTAAFRAAYRDVVVGLLEDHYFRPIFEWHERRGTSMLADQVSRGDLRLGRRAYGDYMQTMRWYNGPGNDDPDLTSARSVAAFKVSASIARLNDRPYVANEAFHSSGWGIAPATILAGLNAGFGYGVNHVIIHGLDYTSDGGWWEWASPDFHFRQPWWQHSEPLWAYITRTCAVLRWGHAVVDVAVLDPTQDLDLTGDSATSPEVAVSVLAALAEGGHDCDLLDRQHLLAAHVVDRQLKIGRCAYRVLVIPDMRAVRSDALQAIDRFRTGGGVLVVLGDPPASTELGSIAANQWSGAHRSTVGSVHSLPQLLASLGEPDFDARGSGLVAAHRRSGSTDLYFVTNATEQHVRRSVDVRAQGPVEAFDAWTGTVSPCRSAAIPGRPSGTRIPVDLAPGLATVLVLDGHPSVHKRDAWATANPAAATVTEITGPWQVEVVPVLDNQFGDFEYGGEPMGVESWHLETSPDPAGPWTPTIVRDGAKFLVLGPVRAEHSEFVEGSLRGTVPQLGDALMVAGREVCWRPYSFSYQTGVTDDPLLLDRMTGPHGLKHVPDEFLDPHVCDPDAPAGSLYYFWSTVHQPTSDAPPREVMVTAGSRAPYRLWVDDLLLLDQPHEVLAVRTPAWNLRDLSVANQTTVCALAPGRTTVLLRLCVSGTQPSRASVAIGEKLPSRPPRARLRWWHGDHPCLRFEPQPDDPLDSLWVSATAPPGTIRAQLTAYGVVRTARLMSSGQQLSISSSPGEHGTSSVQLACAEPASEADQLLMQVDASTSGYRGAAVLNGPITWSLGPGTATSTAFIELGLKDFSGLVRFRAGFPWEPTDAAVSVRLPQLRETAKVTLNDRPLGVVISDQQEVDATSALREGRNEIEVEVANTVVNRFSVLPSPFSHMQPPGGGFDCIQLIARSVR